MRILIMAGGTGGHVFPALSIAEYLRANGVHVEWLGTRQGLEASVIPGAAIPIHFISISGLRGKSLWKKLIAPFLILVAIFQSMLKLVSVKPNCVLGMGGFVTGPGGVAAWLLRKKLLIHEQNAIAGFTNQLLFPIASTVMEAFPGSFERKRQMTANAFMRSFIKSERAIAVGNPVRSSILEIAAPELRFREPVARLKVLVLGGSLGAQGINRLVPAVVAEMNELQRPELLHQCGERNLDETLGWYRDSELEPGESFKVVRFIEDMAAAYGWADLVICRSGAITVSELANAGLGSILIPYPYAVDDHQTANARILADKSAAVLIQQSDLTVASMKDLLERLSYNRQELLDMALAARSLARPEATENAGDRCMEACRV